ncbi:solute carrier family 35 member G1-like [Apostichopus japonicus]|uniref:solute carrier family 35 member G1-like n=1 Tax=Stichopus japonicus TaxID=307972 RepID=UPI003AB261DD
METSRIDPSLVKPMDRIACADQKVTHKQISVDSEGNDREDSLDDDGGLCFSCKRPGLFWAVIAGLSQTLQVLLLAETAHALNSLQTMFFRSLPLLVFVLFISWEEAVNYDSQDLVLNILYGLFDVIGVSSFLFSTGFLSVSDATAIVCNQPIPSTLFACIFLGEVFDVTDGALVILNAIGLVLICKTSMENYAASSQGPPFVGVSIALFALLCVVLLKATARKLAHRGREDPSLVSLIVGCSGTMLSTVCLTLTDSWDMPSTTQEILLSILLGLTAIVHFYSFSKALQTENMMYIATAITLSIPVAYCYDVIFKGIILSLVTIIGVGLSMGSTLLLYVKTCVANHD